MKNTLIKPQYNKGETEFIGCIAILIFVVILYLETWWAQTLLYEFTGRLQNFCLVGGVLILLNLVTPKKLSGLPLFCMFIAQLYLWFVR